jgi:hypothetical protein
VVDTAASLAAADASAVDVLTQMQTNIDSVLRASTHGGEDGEYCNVGGMSYTSGSDAGQADDAPEASPPQIAAEKSAVIYRFRAHRDHYIDELQRHSAVLGPDADLVGRARSSKSAAKSSVANESKAHMAGLQAAADTVGSDVSHLCDLFFNGIAPPPTVATAFAKLKYLDLSFGSVRSLDALSHFPSLDTLVADQNSISSLSELPTLPELTTLSLNKNKVRDLAVVLQDAREKLPKLAYLSLIGNPCTPDESAKKNSGGRLYKLYCEKVAAFLPGLVYLDSHRISPERRSKALANAAVIEALAGEFEGAVAAARAEPTTPSERSAKRRYSTRRALWANGEAPVVHERERVRKMLSQEELSTRDPLLQLAQEKVSTGLLSSHEYMHIASMHRAVSGRGIESDDSSDDDEDGGGGGGGGTSGGASADGEVSKERAPRGSFFGGLLDTGFRFLRSGRSADPPEDGPAEDGQSGSGASNSGSPVRPLQMDDPDSPHTLLMKSAKAKLEAGVISQPEYDHIVGVHSKSTVEALAAAGDDPPTPQGRCAAVRLSRRQRPQLYNTTVSRDSEGKVAVAVKVTPDEHVVVMLADPNTHISVGDRILSANNTVTDPGQIVRLLASGSESVRLDLLRGSD